MGASVGANECDVVFIQGPSSAGSRHSSRVVQPFEAWELLGDGRILNFSYRGAPDIDRLEVE